MRDETQIIEGRNAVLEALRSGQPIDRLFVQDGCQDGPVNSIKREAKKRQVPVSFVARERLDQDLRRFLRRLFGSIPQPELEQFQRTLNVLRRNIE